MSFFSRQSNNSILTLNILSYLIIAIYAIFFLFIYLFFFFFSKLLDELVVSCPPNKAYCKERSANDFMRGVVNDAYVILFPIFLI